MSFTCMGMSWLLCLVVVGVFAQQHTCIHDQMNHPPPVKAPQQYHNQGRRLQDTEWAPIRFTFVDQMTFSSALKTFATELTTAATTRWSELLDVIPVQGNLKAKRVCNSYWQSNGRCAGYATPRCGTSSAQVNIAVDYLEDALVYSQPTASPSVIPGGAGVPNTDYVIFLTSNTCNSGVLGHASSCQMDQYDRPFMAVINICSSALISVFAQSDSRYEMWVDVLIHEIGHALGFSSTFWPLFRNKDAERTPKTPRNPSDPSEVVSSYFQYSSSCSKQFAYPHSNTLQFFNERGMSCAYGGKVSPMEDCVHKLTGPQAVAAAKSFFDCDEMNGIELENHDTGSCALHSSHLENRLFRYSIMAAYASKRAKLTAIELAVLDDSGWYTPHYEKADPVRPGHFWGYKQGCAFALQKCVVDGVAQGYPPHFVVADGTACTLDRTAIGDGAVRSYSSSALKTQYRYFPTLLGGDIEYIDFCPVVVAYSNGDCSDTANMPSNRYYGQWFGPNSICFESTLLKTGYSGSDVRASCYEYTCLSSQELQITVKPGGGANDEFVSCTGSGGDQHAVNGLNGHITCPDVQLYCGDNTDPGVVIIEQASVMATSTRTAEPTPSRTPSTSPSNTRTPSSTPSPTRTPITPSSALPTRPGPTATGTGSITKSASATRSLTPTPLPDGIVALQEEGSSDGADNAGGISPIGAGIGAAIGAVFASVLAFIGMQCTKSTRTLPQ